MRVRVVTGVCVAAAVIAVAFGVGLLIRPVTVGTVSCHTATDGGKAGLAFVSKAQYDVIVACANLRLRDRTVGASLIAASVVTGLTLWIRRYRSTHR